MQGLILKLWIFFGFRIWGITLVLVISYFGTTSLLPFLPEQVIGWIVSAWGAIWISRSAYKLFTSKDPGIDHNN